MASIDFRAVAESVSVRQVAEAAGLAVRSGRVKCPFCDGARHDNFKLNDGGRPGYCFACHHSADAVDLAAQLWHLTRLEAAQELNQRFRLGLDADEVDGAELERRRAEREAARQAEAEARAARAREYGEAADELREAERALLRRSDRAWTSELTAAVQRMARAQDGWNNLWAELSTEKG